MRPSSDFANEINDKQGTFHLDDNPEQGENEAHARTDAGRLFIAPEAGLEMSADERKLVRSPYTLPTESPTDKTAQKSEPEDGLLRASSHVYPVLDEWSRQVQCRQCSSK